MGLSCMRESVPNYVTFTEIFSELFTVHLLVQSDINWKQYTVLTCVLRYLSIGFSSLVRPRALFLGSEGGLSDLGSPESPPSTSCTRQVALLCSERAPPASRAFSSFSRLWAMLAFLLSGELGPVMICTGLKDPQQRAKPTSETVRECVNHLCRPSYEKRMLSCYASH